MFKNSVLVGGNFTAYRLDGLRFKFSQFPGDVGAHSCFFGQQQQQSSQTQKNSQNDQQPQDTVVLSKKATEATQTNDLAQGDPDHDGH